MKGKRILIIDDNKDILELLGARLSGAGYQVYKYRDGKNILDKVKMAAPDIILLDIMMPGINGMDVKAELNEDPIGATIPVIFVTAQDAVSEKIKGLHLGAEDYITKPFDPAELLARVEGAIKRKAFYEKISMTDGLTGLHNINFFKKQMKTFFNIAQRYERTFSLAIMDIDDFKDINDTYGHAAGDFVLKTFSRIVLETLRKADMVMRYGGDEFAVIMPQTDESQAAVVIKRLKGKIKNKMFLFEDTQAEITFFFSAGVAAYEKKFTNEKEMFEFADNRLYEEKNRKKKNE